jgi:hypothetical protein
MHYGEIPDGIQIDHINNVVGDNRIENLRLATSKQNNMNRARSCAASGRMGVYYNKRDKKWQSLIYVGGKNIHLGWFDKKDDAIFARETAEEKYGFFENHGKGAA